MFGGDFEQHVLVLTSQVIGHIDQISLKNGLDFLLFEVESMCRERNREVLILS